MRSLLFVSSAAQLRYGLKPLWQLQEGVAAIRRGEAEKIEGDFPQDLAPLASELNLLIGANRDVVERARTQVGNLAHALKTPLSVIIQRSGGRSEPARGEGGGAGGDHARSGVLLPESRPGRGPGAERLASVTEVAPATEALVRTFEKIYSDAGG